MEEHKNFERMEMFYRSDVILLCYDTTRIETLQNCRTFWHQEIKKCCPDTPMLLGKQIDDRYFEKIQVIYTYILT